MEVEAFELDEVTVAELSRSMGAGERSARSIVDLYLDRIESLNERGPELRAIIDVDPDAERVADELDAERAERGPRGPLHGIAVVVKDNVDTAALATTAGSLALEGAAPGRDAFVVDRLRAAGAIVLAKANLSEWANFRGERSTSGWSALGGQCRNPYALDRNPCGSSSGSAVAVAANLAPVAIGTETNGSIVCPASVNGVVGLKPTVGLWSRSGIVPISSSQDTAGPMCRTVADAALVLGAAVGVDPADQATAMSEGRAHDDYTQFLDGGALGGARVGIALPPTRFDPRMVALLDEATAVMRERGAVVVDVDLGADAWRHPRARTVLEYEFKHTLDAYLAGRGAGCPVASLADVIDFNERHAGRELVHFGQELLVASQARGSLSDDEYRQALAAVRQATRDHGIDAAVAEHGLDAIVSPSVDVAWVTDHVRGDPRSASSAAPAAIAGYPNITVPMGFVRGLPAGLSFFGPAWSEPTLLGLAYAFEQATMHRRPPTFAPSA